MKKISNIQFYFSNKFKSKIFLDKICLFFSEKLNTEIILQNLDDYESLFFNENVDIYYQIVTENTENLFSTSIRLVLHNDWIKDIFDYFDFIDELSQATSEQLIIPIGDTSYDYLLFDSEKKYFIIEENGQNQKGGIEFYSRKKVSKFESREIVKKYYI